MDLRVSFVFTAEAVALAGLLNMLPITIMGLGTREMTSLFVFEHLAVPHVLAFSSMVFLIAQLGGGVVALVMGELALASSRVELKQQGVFVEKNEESGSQHHHSSLQ